MKYFIVHLIISSCSFVTAQSNDFKSIATTLNYYLDGGTNNDYSTLIKAFHKDAEVKFINDNNEIESKKAKEFFGGMKPGPKSNRKTRIANINVTGHAANAHIVIEFPDFEFNDYMTLLKVNGEWKIVTKIFFGEKKEFNSIK